MAHSQFTDLSIGADGQLIIKGLTEADAHVFVAVLAERDGRVRRSDGRVQRVHGWRFESRADGIETGDQARAFGIAVEAQHDEDAGVVAFQTFTWAQELTVE